MRFLPAPLAGAFIIEPERIEDERGFFARTYCRREFRELGLDADLVQCSISYNRRQGTLRGMHYQDAPHAEAKLVRCTRGRIYDVIIDLRGDSVTRYQWHAVELSADNRRMLYAPPGFAHGFQALEDDTEVYYQMSQYHEPDSARGVRWDDPLFGIPWPLPVSEISAQDAGFPYLFRDTQDEEGPS